MALGLNEAFSLHSLLCTPLVVEPRSNLPLLRIHPLAFVRSILCELARLGVTLASVHLEGSAAAVCLSPDSVQTYNDLDFVFHLRDQDSNTLHLAREAVMASIAQVYCPSPSFEHLALAPSYLSKMFLRTCPISGDAWALYSFVGFNCPGMDLKFVSACERPYQFSMDSVYIVLDTIMLDLLQPQPSWKTLAKADVARSYFGDIEAVKGHISRREIVVSDVADVLGVHGGALFKYATLLSRGWAVAGVDRAVLEHNMCERFQQDFPNSDLTGGAEALSAQVQRLNVYLRTHYIHAVDTVSALAFMHTLREVVLRAGHAGCGSLLRALTHLLGPVPAPAPAHAPAPVAKTTPASPKQQDAGEAESPLPVSPTPPVSPDPSPMCSPPTVKVSTSRRRHRRMSSCGLEAARGLSKLSLSASAIKQ